MPALHDVMIHLEEVAHDSHEWKLLTLDREECRVLFEAMKRLRHLTPPDDAEEEP